MTLKLHWQQQKPEALPTTPCPTLAPDKSRRDPFHHAPTATLDFTRYSLAQIEWLGVVTAPHQSAALIRLPNQAIRLIRPGMLLGQDQWRLQQLTPAYAQFIDVDQHIHQWPLHLDTPLMAALA